MHEQKIIPISAAPRNKNEDILKETMILQGISNSVLTICGNSPSLGHGQKLDDLAIKVEIELFKGLLDACAENPNFDSEIFFDSFTSDLREIFNRLHREFNTFQEYKIKNKLNIKPENSEDK